MLITLLFTYSVYANNNVSILEIPVRDSLPENIVTVEQAVNWFIEPTKYKLLAHDTETWTLLLKPTKKGTGEIVPVLSAIQRVIGQGYITVLDTQHHLLTFEAVKTTGKDENVVNVLMKDLSGYRPVPRPNVNQVKPVDPLEVPVRTIYPPEIKTTGQAVEWLMEPLGYHILTDYPAPDSASSLLESPIPAAARMHRTMPVTHALQLLIGEGNTIIVDRPHKLITFAKGVIL